jgi:hypothetical protein
MMDVIEQRQQGFLRGARHLRRVLGGVMRTVGEEVAGEFGPVGGAGAAGRYGGK